MDKISIIVPCYNEEKVLSAFYRETSAAVRDIEGAECEFIFVDDGSRDHTPDILQSLSRADRRCKYISFSRNFGKEAAMYAGLSNASGDYCVIMDADLQHPPALLKEMYRVVKTEGYDCCAGLRQDRTGEGHLRNILSRTFYRIINRMCRLDMTDGAGDFRMMSRKMVDAVLQLKEPQRYLKGIYAYVGFQTKWLPFHNVERAAGAGMVYRVQRYLKNGRFPLFPPGICLILLSESGENRRRFSRKVAGLFPESGSTFFEKRQRSSESGKVVFLKIGK